MMTALVLTLVVSQTEYRVGGQIPELRLDESSRAEKSGGHSMARGKMKDEGK